ncbi:MAG TPA: hypothetical protein VGO52_05845, partial [Hyphomonadaceae bacterium]|nr:hypothetical protein [Hyphomonadaceae bacterium]
MDLGWTELARELLCAKLGQALDVVEALDAGLQAVLELAQGAATLGRGSSGRRPAHGLEAEDLA